MKNVFCIIVIMVLVVVPVFSQTLLIEEVERLEEERKGKIDNILSINNLSSINDVENRITEQKNDISNLISKEEQRFYRNNIIGGVGIAGIGVGTLIWAFSPPQGGNQSIIGLSIVGLSTLMTIPLINDNYITPTHVDKLHRLKSTEPLSIALLTELEEINETYYKDIERLNNAILDDADFTEKEQENIIEKTIHIGMREEVLVHSWNDIRAVNTNRTETAVSKQYVYHSGSYVYTDNGIITTIQN